MESLLWLLLPLAAASGWITARMTQRRSSQSSSEQSANFSQNCIEGLNYLLSEQSDKAINLLVEMVDVDEDTVETHLILGSLFRRRGEVDRAIRIHQNIINRRNLSPEQRSNALLQLGLDYLKAGLLDRAEDVFLQLASSGVNKQEAFTFLAAVYEQEKEWRKSIDAVQQLNGNDEGQITRLAHYHCELAERYVKEDRPDLAASEARQALHIDQDCIRAYIQLGDLHLNKGDQAQALSCFSSALERNQYFSPLVLKHLYDYFAEHGDLDQMVRFVEAKADINTDAAARFFLIRSFSELGYRDRVEAMLRDELSRREVSPYIIKSYLEMMQERTEGEVSESFSSLERALNSRLDSYMACQCTQCGFESNAIFWQCPTCQTWGTVRPYPNPQEYSWLETENP